MFKKIFLVIFTILICISFSSCKKEYSEPSTDGYNMSGLPPIGIYSKFVYDFRSTYLVDNEIKVQFGRLSKYNPYAYDHLLWYGFVDFPVIQNIQIALLADSFEMNPQNIIKLYQISFSEFASKKYEIEVDEEGYVVGDIPTFTFSLNELLADRIIKKGIFLVISYDSYIGNEAKNYQLNIFGYTTDYGSFRVIDVAESYFECNHIDFNDFAKNPTKEEKSR